MNNSRQEYPKPTTPVDKAWSKMAEMMDSEMPVASKNLKKRAFSTSISQFVISVAAAMVFVGGGAYFAIKHNKKEISFNGNYSKQQNISTDIADTFQLGDTVPEINTVTLTYTVDTLPDEGVFQQPPPDFSYLNSGAAPVGEERNIQETQAVEKHIEYEPGVESIDLHNSTLTKTTLKSKKPLFNLNWFGKNFPDKTFSAQNKPPKKNRTRNYPNNNHLFVGLSENNSLLFSGNLNGNIYSYGTLLNIGMRNSKYNFAVETGIGVQFLEHHVPYGRTLYIYRASGTTDSTITVSSYKYNYQQLAIPLFVEKTVYRYKRFSFDLKAGVNTSVFLSRKRLFNQLPGDIETVESTYNPSRLNFSFGLSPKFCWNVKDKISFSLSPSGVIYLNSLYENYSVKPYGLDLSAGIYYTF